MIVCRAASLKNGFRTGIVNAVPNVPDGAIWNADEFDEYVARA